MCIIEFHFNVKGSDLYSDPFFENTLYSQLGQIRSFCSLDIIFRMVLKNLLTFYS